MHAESQRPSQRRQQIGAAVVFRRDDRPPPRARVAAEREHRHLRVDARSDDARRVETDREFVGAGRAPSRRRRPAATALQWQNQIQHGASVPSRTDMTERWGRLTPPFRHATSEQGRKVHAAEDTGEFRSDVSKDSVGVCPQ